ncbi:MAG: class I SAM-dependent methyltransferase [bacterium]|nr:class I SAM-dependent methyltransferase [bacterium]
MKSVFYKSALFYDWGIRFLYLGGLKILKDMVGQNKTVFEAACGYGRMQKFLHPCCTYSGIDLNESFISYGQKKNRDVKVGNVLDENAYPKADVVLLCDILHHLPLKDMYKLVSIAAKSALEKVVIVEPVFVTIGSKNNIFSRMASKIMKVFDSDGFNDIERWLSREEYDQLFDSFKEKNNLKEMTILNHRNHDFVEMVV